MGGPKAPQGVEESVNGNLARIDEQNLELSGRLVDYKSEGLPW
tara:strand:+ start:976 stop:1104 length:129 start_codon:yes stop_codon:yes gene_type:complete